MSSDTSTTNGMSRREELLAVATSSPRGVSRHPHGRRGRRGRPQQGHGVPLLRQQVADPLRHLQAGGRFDRGRAARRPTASARETIYHFTRRLLVGIANDLEQAAVYFQEGPYITEWFTEDQVAYIRDAETQVYEHVRDVIDRGIASGEFYDATPSWLWATSA